MYDGKDVTAEGILRGVKECRLLKENEEETEGVNPGEIYSLFSASSSLDLSQVLRRQEMLRRGV